MAHKFIYENTYEEQLPVKVEFTIPSDADLNDMCEEFTNYLRAVGFHIPQGNYLDFVNDDGDTEKGWDDFFEKENTVTEDFCEYGNYGENNPPVGETKKKLWDATPQDWNNAYKSVTVSYDGVKYKEHD